MEKICRIQFRDINFLLQTHLVSCTMVSPWKIQLFLIVSDLPFHVVPSVFFYVEGRGRKLLKAEKTSSPFISAGPQVSMANFFFKWSTWWALSESVIIFMEERFPYPLQNFEVRRWFCVIDFWVDLLTFEELYLRNYSSDDKNFCLYIIRRHQLIMSAIMKYI